MAVSRNKPVFTADAELIFQAAENAWALSPEEWSLIQDGAMGVEQALALLKIPSSADQPLVPKTRFDFDNPHIHILKLLQDPEFFAFTCRSLFVRPDGAGPLRILPFQQLALRELWWRQFPMIVASRGSGKTFLLAVYALLRATFTPGAKIVITAAAFRQAKAVFEYMERIWHNSPVFRSLVNSGRAGSGRKNGPRRDIDRVEFVVGDSVVTGLPTGDGCLVGDTMVTLGDRVASMSQLVPHSSDLQYGVENPCTVWDGQEFRPSDESYCNGRSQTVRVISNLGIVIEGTPNHKVQVYRDTGITWKRLDEISQEDRLVVDRSERWHNGDSGRTEEEGYALGLLIGDGCWTNPYTIGYATLDNELIEGVRRGTGFLFKHHFENDPHHYTHCGKQDRAEWLRKWGLRTAYSGDKVLPPVLLASRKSVVAACLSGIFDTDGTLSVHTNKEGTSASVGLSTTSPVLVKQVQYLLLHFGILSRITSRKRSDKWATSYELLITGPDVAMFAERVGFRLSRKREKLAAGLGLKKRGYSTRDMIPGLEPVLAEVSRDAGLLKCEVVKRKASRSYAADIVRRLPHGHSRREQLEKLVSPSIYFDPVSKIEFGEAVTYDCHVLETHAYVANGVVSHNTKIRGLRANYVLTDEVASLNEEVYAVVVQGFASVTADPVGNVVDYARIRLLKRLGMWSDEMDAEERKRVRGNQSVLTGTAYYSFNHFARYWREYKTFIESRGDPKALEKVFNGPPPDGFDWRQYSIIRLPYSLIPHGYMDEATIARAKRITNTGQFLMEYSATFLSDSDGFFKRSLVERCVVGKPDDPDPVSFPSCGPVKFTAALQASGNCKYVYGIDPASENDRFAVVIVEIWPEHRRVVYCWTTRKADHTNKLRKKMVGDHDFFRYCVRKIRDLFKVFPPARVLVDAGGGGITLREAFGDPDKLEPGELPVYEVVDPKDKKPTDNLAGDHLLEMVVFRDNAWVVEANDGMKKDLEDRVLLFPMFNSLTLGLTEIADEAAGRVGKDERGEKVYQTYDTLEQAMLEIEKLKDELATIEVSESSTGLRRWDTPDRKVPGSKAGRMRKDRYSALLMANMGARQLARALPVFTYKGGVGGFISEIASANPASRGEGGPLYQAPPWFTNKLGSRGYGGAVVIRGGV
jgi:intein/homing endonuclease